MEAVPNKSHDCWDDIISLDKDQFDLGVAEGIIDGQQSGFKQDGIKAGLLKGFALGLELSYYDNVITTALANSTTDGLTDSITSKRKNLEKIVDSIHQIDAPINNVDIDYEAELNKIRSLYKAIPTSHLPAGSFLLKQMKDQQASQSW